MSVLAQFTVPSEDIPIGRIVQQTPVTRMEFERIIPTGDAIMPYIWVTSDDFEPFEVALAESPLVIDFHRLDRFDDVSLYRIEWKRGEGMLLQGIVDTEGAVLTGEVDNELLQFLVRFPDHDQLAQFYNYCMENEVPVTMQRVYSLTERSERAEEYGLTEEQREALVLAAQHGYFSSPREVTMDELASDLGITQQAVSQRVRRASEKVILAALGLSHSE